MARRGRRIRQGFRLTAVLFFLVVLVALIGIVLMLGAPFVMGLILGAMPDMGAFWKGFVQVAMVYIPSCIVEFLIYTKVFLIL